ncbi:MAG: hypothetical protein H0V97_06400 [Actinobacteria bacterium]|nr:hypothetical protein [Actinomycetota bacterium]
MSLRGLDWNRDTVKNIEDGTREVPIAEFFPLVYVLHESLEELFPADLVLELAGGHQAQGETQLGEMLGPRGDATVTPDPLRLGAGLPVARALTDPVGSSDSIEVVLTKGPPGNAEGVTKLADQKAAASLETTVAEVRKLAQRTWGRDVTAERDARVAQRLGDKHVSRRSLQALRGHVTRELLDELRPKIRRRRSKK